MITIMFHNNMLWSLVSIFRVFSPNPPAVERALPRWWWWFPLTQLMSSIYRVRIEGSACCLEGIGRYLPPSSLYPCVATTTTTRLVIWHGIRSFSRSLTKIIPPHTYIQRAFIHTALLVARCCSVTLSLRYYYYYCCCCSAISFPCLTLSLVDIVIIVTWYSFGRGITLTEHSSSSSLLNVRSDISQPTNQCRPSTYQSNAI